MLASVVISTYNRSEALPATLEALAHQSLPSDDYEVLVVDDGSTDRTPEVLERLHLMYPFRTFRRSSNSGVSAGRNVGLRAAKGRYVILLSDDLVVPVDFIRRHIETLERFPRSWVVGGFAQLESLNETPFGRFLNELELRFERGRTGPRIDDEMYEMTIPTARNLSIPRRDLEEVGLFDERFRVTCEDQDLAQRAASHGIRFIFNAGLQCVHNDQAADLLRYCRFQERGARDTASLCDKYPELHGWAQIVTVNSYIDLRDGPGLVLRKLLKQILATSAMTQLLETLIRLAEMKGMGDRPLNRLYRLLIGLYTFRGFRQGMREIGGRDSALARFRKQSRYAGNERGRSATT